MDKIKNILKNTVYILATIGIIDMFIQVFTKGEFKLIHSILGLFFEKGGM